MADILFLTLQTLLPSEPSARVAGLSAIEAPVRPARTRQQILTVVHDLKGNPEPLKLLNLLKTLISSLNAGETAFAMEVSQMCRQTNVKTACADVTFLATLDLLEIELSSGAHEYEEEKRRQKSANLAIAASAAVGKGSGKSKPSTKPTCRDYLTARRTMLFPPSIHTTRGRRVQMTKTREDRKGKAAAKPKAEAGRIEIDWASQTNADPFASSLATIEEVACRWHFPPIRSRSHCFHTLHYLSSFCPLDISDRGAWSLTSNS